MYRTSRKASYISLVLFVIAAATCCALPDMQNINKPNPEPSAQAGWDVFTPSVSGSAASGTPIIGEWTRIGGPDDTLVLTGDALSSFSGTSEGKDTQFLVFGQTTSSDGMLAGAGIQRLDGNKAAVTLHSVLPDWSVYLMWPKNNNGFGNPVAINKAEVWWVGPNDKVTRGDTVSVYGRNLSHDNGTASSWVYVKPSGSTGWWATVTSVNPYRVQFTVPSQCSNGTYEVWVHNGHGGSYGWGGPVTLTVTDALSWDTESYYNIVVTQPPYNAQGDGSTDDTLAIFTAYTTAAARRDGGHNCTVEFPPGTYMVSSNLIMRGGIRYKGAGMDETIIRAKSTLNNGIMNNTGYAAAHFEVRDLTLDGNGYIPPYEEGVSTGKFVLGSALDSDIRFTNVRFSTLTAGTTCVNITGPSRLFFTNCEFEGGNVFLGDTRQVFVSDCYFYPANDVLAALQVWGTSDFSVTGCYAEDYDIGSSTGQGLGRLVAAAYNNSNHYIAHNTTVDLAPRFEHNSGEQVLYEGTYTLYEGNPTSVTPTTVQFSDLSLQSADLINRVAIIIGGKGLGQYRKITNYNPGTKTITVSPAWNVLPDTNSVVLLERSAVGCVIYDNILDGKSTYTQNNSASMGFATIGGTYGLIADSNVVTDMRFGMILNGNQEITAEPWKNPRNSIWPLYSSYIANNEFTNCYYGLKFGGFDAVSGPAVDCVGALGNVFRNNYFSNVSDIGVYLFGSTGAPPAVDLNLFEQNVFTNLPKGFDFDRSDNGTLTESTILYRNTFNRGTATYSDSYAADFGSNTLLPALRDNVWQNFQTTYVGSTPGAILEVPNRVIEVYGGEYCLQATAELPIWNSGTSSLSWTASSDEEWLTLSDESGTVSNESGESVITLICDQTGMEQGVHTATVTITGAGQTKKVTVVFTVDDESRLPVGNSSLWVKADIGVSITSGKVTNWADQSGSGNDLTPLYVDGRPTRVDSAINGKPAIHFDGQWNNLRKVLGTPLSGSFTTFVVYAAPDDQIRTGESGGTWNRIVSCPITTVGYNDGYGFMVRTEAASSFAPRLNTVETTLNAGHYLKTFGLGLQHLSDGYVNQNCAFNGDIAEVIIYNRALNSDEKAAVETYLRNKYAIPDIPTDAAMKLWVRGDLGVNKDGSNNVSSWTDMSGAGNDLIPLYGHCPSYVASAIDGKPAIRFDGDEENLRKALDDPLPGTFTTFVVCAAPDDQVRTTESGGAQNRIVSCPATVTGDDFNGFMVTTGKGTSFDPELRTCVETLTTGVYLRTFGLGVKHLSFGNYWPNQAFNGDIAEVIIYNRALSQPETDAVTNYLKAKYSLP